MSRFKTSTSMKVFFILVISLSATFSALTREPSDFTFKISSATKFDAPLHEKLISLEQGASGKLSASELDEYKKLLETSGWPTYKSAGIDGIDAAAKLLFRSSLDPDFQIAVLRYLNAEQVGDDIDPLQFARLSDAISLINNGSQTYGTVLIVDERGTVRPNGTLKNEDGRLFLRDFYGLPTLNEDIANFKPNDANGFDGSSWDGHLGRATPTYSRPDIRNELGRMIAPDQDARHEVARAKGDQRAEKIAKVKEIDAENLPKIKEIFKQVGFPTVAMVGRDGVSTAFLLVQHADADPKFQEYALELAEPLMKRRELSRRQYAYLVDRVRLGKGEKQIYGTQVDVVSGKAVVKPVVDPKNLDARRAEMFMGPEADYLKLF